MSFLAMPFWSMNYSNYDSGTPILLMAPTDQLFVYYSEDAVTWATYSAGTSTTWRSSAYSPTLGVFLFGGSVIRRSLDGKTWTTHTKATGFDFPYAICWGSDKFVEVGGNNVGMYSTDGQSWTASTMPANLLWTGVDYSPTLNLYIAASVTGTTNRIAKSTDGITWTGVTSPNENLSKVKWVSELNLFVITTTGTQKNSIYSSDGTTWTYSTTAGANNNWQGMAWSDSLKLLVTVADTGTGNRARYTSNANTWTASSTSGFDSSWVGVEWFNNKFHSVAHTGTWKYMTSTNGTSWATASGLNNSLSYWQVLTGIVK
jgi:hypothetical protein